MLDLKNLKKSYSNVNGHHVLDIVTEENQIKKALVINKNQEIRLVPLLDDVEKIYIEITSKCNFDCVTCIRNIWQEETGQMKESMLNNIIDQLAKLPNVKTVHFGGFGEPLTYPNMLEVIEKVKAMGIKVEMVTNGSLLTDSVRDALIDLKLDKLFVSIDGTQEKFADIRKGGEYDDVINNLHALVDSKKQQRSRYPIISLVFVAMKKNITHLPKLKQIANDLGVYEILVTNVMPYTHHLKDEIIYDIDDTIPLLGGNDSLWTMLRASLPPMKLRTYRNCKFITDKALCITWQGDVSPCYPLMHSHKCFVYNREKRVYKKSFGNIYNETISGIWTKPDYARFRSHLLNNEYPSCTDCKYLDGCSYTDDNEADCWGNSPSCADCLWSREMIVCP